MNTVALVLALAVLVTGLAAAAIVRLLPTLRSQLVALALLAVCLPLGVVLASGLVMFGMHDDAKIVSVAVVSTLCALGGALVLGRRILHPLGPLVAGGLAAVEAEARASKVSLESRIDPADPAVRVAPEKIERVLLNLLGNAVRHARRDGTVAVIVEPDTDHVLVAVEDTGDGVAPETRQRMFDRFWREDDSRARSSGGAGLGLAISQGLVQAHGGKIWAENRTGGGARVAFTLPLATDGSLSRARATDPA